MPKLLNKLNLPRYSSAPASPAEADLYYNTSDDKIYVYTGAAWVEVGSGAGGSGVYYQSDAPVSPNDGDIWIDSDDEVASVTSITDSTSTTSSTVAASATAVKSAYDAAVSKVSSVTGTSPISSSGGTTPAISIASASTSAVGAVQLEDSTSSTSTTKAATPNSVKSAYDLANGAIAKSLVDASGDLIVGTGADTVGRLAVGSSDQVLVVSSGSPAWAYKPNVVTNAQTGTTYTLALSDSGKLVELSNAAAITLTVPTNSVTAFPTGTQIDLLQTGAGQVTVEGAGVTLQSEGSKLKLKGQYAAATLIKRATDTWVLIGNTSA